MFLCMLHVGSVCSLSLKSNEERQLGGVRLHTSFLGCSCHCNAYLQDNKRTFSHPERHFGSKIKFLVLDMKLPNSRSFAITNEENKRGLALEDNTSVNVLVYRCNGMKV